MPSLTIRASARKVVSISGRIAQTVARQERNANRQSRLTARYTPITICVLAFLTTMLVALSMPALPAAKMKRACSLLNSSLKA
ncbi:hypothetical protein D3C84_923950 [compost metagenome]